MRAILGLIVAMLSFQAGASIAKQLIPAIGAPGTTALRLGLSALLVALIRRPWRVWPTARAWPAVLVYGASLGIMNFVFYMAIRTIPLGVAVSLEFTGPLAVALWGSRRLTDMAWVALAVFGVLLLLDVAPGEHLDAVGVGYALAAGVCWALYIVFGQRAGHAVGTAASMWGMLVAAAIIVPIGVADAGSALLSPTVLLQGAGVAVLSSALPYTLEMVALRQLSTRTFGTLMSLEPAIAALAGVLLLSEHLAGIQWLGVAAIMAASAGAVQGERAPVVSDPV